MHISNIIIGTLCVAHHADDFLSGNYDYINSHNAFVITCKLEINTNKLIEIVNFKPHSDGHGDFSLHWDVDMSRITWNDVETFKENL